MHALQMNTYAFKPIVIGIDHGNSDTKTAHASIRSGVSTIDAGAFTTSGLLVYGGKRYICGGARQPLMTNKTQDETCFVMTLYMLAYELNKRGIGSNSMVTIAGGLPLTSFARQKDEFKTYLKRKGPVEFECEGTPYRIEIHDVKLYPQGYAVVAAASHLTSGEPSTIIADVGGWTVDVMKVDARGVPDVDLCISLEYGVIRCINMIIERVRQVSGITLDENQVKSVLKDERVSIAEDIKDAMRRYAREYIRSLLRTLAEHGYDIHATPILFMGGGASVVERFADSRDLGNARIISDVAANAKAYERLAQSM